MILVIWLSFGFMGGLVIENISIWNYLHGKLLTVAEGMPHLIRVFHILVFAWVNASKSPFWLYKVHSMVKNTSI